MKRLSVEKQGTKQGLTCGIIMPISSIDGCSAEHWLEVKSIIVDAVQGISDYDFQVSLVSEQDDVGVIQKRIVQNVYNSDIVVCDVSCKNPNVMFELGMRLAFDKPTVIVKDDKTDYSFDTGVIEHIPYPRDLRFSRVVLFKNALAEKVKNTYRVSLEDPEHSTFLKSFGDFKVAGITQTEVTSERLILEMLSDLTNEFSRFKRSSPDSGVKPSRSEKNVIEEGQLLETAVLSYLGEYPQASLGELVNSEELADYVERHFKVHEIYANRRAFVSALNRYIKSVTGG